MAAWLSKHEAGQTLETARLSRIIRRPLQYTNLFDVIASLGAGLYVHHIEFASFPLCRLYRDLPATDPGEGGEGGSGGGVRGDDEGKHKNNQDDMNGRRAKIKQTNKKKG